MVIEVFNCDMVMIEESIASKSKKEEYLRNICSTIAIYLRIFGTSLYPFRQSKMTNFYDSDSVLGIPTRRLSRDRCRARVGIILRDPPPFGDNVQYGSGTARIRPSKFTSKLLHPNFENPN